MAHKSQLQFIQLLSEHMPHYFGGRRVLEVGSLDINGSVRHFFRECDYTGLDVAAGRGVDVVCEGQKYDVPDGSFDVVISCEAMEHNPYWADTLRNMIRLCRPGGLLVMTCATIGRPEHGTARSEPQSSPLTVGLGWTYYRNLSEKRIRSEVSFDAFAHRFWTKWNHYDLCLAGVKGEPTPEWLAAAKAVTAWAAQDEPNRALRYRRQMSRLGDTWFVAMHRLTDFTANMAARLERMHRIQA